MTDDRALDALFRNARTANGFLDKPVTDDQLRALYDLMKMGPTAANGQPARLVFLRSQAAKERLRPALSAGNLDKTLAAPVCAIVAYDTHFHEHLPRVFPHNATAKSWFDGDANKAARETSAFRNGSMQGGYFILAARAAGSRLRADVGLQQREGRRSLLPGRPVPLELPVHAGRSILPRLSDGCRAWLSTRPASCPATDQVRAPT